MSRMLSVMAKTFTLIGRTSQLSANFHPSIDLDSRYSYSLALTGFHTYNSIPNIEEGVNSKFYYKLPEEKSYKSVKIPTGSYEIADIEKYLQTRLNASEGFTPLTLKPNNNTLKCELSSIYDINFAAQDSLGKLLGFTKRLSAGKLHTSDSSVDIISVTTIRIECNIISGSYYSGKPSHTLYEFSPTTDPGYSININPTNPIYLALNSQKYIDNISVRIIDQNSKLVNFRGEEIIIRLVLKRDGFSI